MTQTPTEVQTPNQPNTPTVVPKRPWYRSEKTLRKGGTHAVILRRGGVAEPHKITAPHVPAKDGWYIAEAQGRFWLNEPIPKGWITIYVEGTAEPVTERPVRGYGPKLIQQLCGDLPLRLVGGGFEAKLEVKPWMKKAILIGGALLVVAFFVYRWWLNRGGA